MKSRSPHPLSGHRIRKIGRGVTWGGAAATVLLALAWTVGMRHTLVFCPHARCALQVSGGALSISLISAQAAQPTGGAILATSAAPDEIFLLPAYYSWRGGTRELVIPLWMFLVPVLTATVFAWRRGRRNRLRERAGHCPACGYDRTGILKDAKCPECGSVPA